MEKNVVNTFIECLLPITACNIKCHYCYVAQRDNRKMRQARLKYPPDIIAKALRKDRVGGTAYISICGAGETMMQKKLPDIVNLLLQEGLYENNDADFDRYAYQRQAIEDGLLHYGATILSPKMRQR